MSVIEHIDAVKKGKISVADHLEKCLKQIEDTKHLNAFLSIFPEKSRKKAHDIDQRIKNRQKVGPLAGLVFAIKDNINIQDELTTCGSKILEPYRSPYNATVIEKLDKAGAIIVGKTNLDEFAMGSSNENSAFGAVKNPHNTNKVPGGSSGGSAVAVASGCVDSALGSDTGGSVRQPASFTGIIGLKPSYGRISRYGLVAYASSLDQIGILAKTSMDAAYILQFIAGHDQKDSTSAAIDIPEYHKKINRNIKGMRLGIPKEYFAEGLDPHIKTGVMSVVKKLEKQGAQVIDVNLATTEYAIAMYYIIATAEASSNLARFDGVRYGYRSKAFEDLTSMYKETRSEGFGDEVRRRIMLGTYVLSAGYYDAYYKKAQQVRRLLKNDFDAAFEKCDVIISPTAPTTAFNLNEKKDNPLAMYLEDIYTVSANLAGICAMSCPAGKHPDGMPFGIQLQARAFNESALFQTGNAIDNLDK